MQLSYHKLIYNIEYAYVTIIKIELTYFHNNINILTGFKNATLTSS